MKLEICIRNAWSNRVHRWAKFRIKKQALLQNLVRGLAFLF